MLPDPHHNRSHAKDALLRLALEDDLYFSKDLDKAEELVHAMKDIVHSEHPINVPFKRA